jgi:cation diffusion facilitator family transporter
MAVLADGWHMSSHSLALGLSAFAYSFARRHSRHRAYAFGTWKMEVLGGYTSAMLLLGIAALMVFQSLERLFVPQSIQYREAIVIAAVGLVVNLVCAWWLRDTHTHGHPHAQDHSHSGDDHDHARDPEHDHHDRDHDHDHGHSHPHPCGSAHADMNMRAAYLHVLADAATSVLAIIALVGGLVWGFGWLDPVMGLVGAALVSVWAWGLMRDSGRILLDAEMDAPVVAEVREVIERGAVPARITDLHVWRVGREKYAVVATVATSSGRDGEYFRRALCVHEELAHVTVEVVTG